LQSDVVDGVVWLRPFSGHQMQAGNAPAECLICLENYTICSQDRKGSNLRCPLIIFKGQAFNITAWMCYLMNPEAKTHQTKILSWLWQALGLACAAVTPASGQSGLMTLCE